MKRMPWVARGEAIVVPCASRLGNDQPTLGTVSLALAGSGAELVFAPPALCAPATVCDPTRLSPSDHFGRDHHTLSRAHSQVSDRRSRPEQLCCRRTSSRHLLTSADDLTAHSRLGSAGDQCFRVPTRTGRPALLLRVHG
jgi:hypothetical protein